MDHMVAKKMMLCPFQFQMTAIRVKLHFDHTRVSQPVWKLTDIKHGWSFLTL